MTEATDKPQLLLRHHLKQLKLPTVLAEYEKVAQECARGGVDHVRYLGVAPLNVENERQALLALSR